MSDEIPPGYRDEATDCFRSMSGRVHGFLRRLTQGDTDLSDELLQETFRKAWQNWSELRDLTKNERSSWLIGVALKTAVDAFRHEETTREKWPQVCVRFAPSEVDVPQEAMTAIAIKHFIRVIERMPPERAKVAFLFWRCGCKNQEIAEMLGITAGRVSQQVRAARATLRNELGLYVPFEPSGTEGGA